MYKRDNAYVQWLLSDHYKILKHDLQGCMSCDDEAFQTLAREAFYSGYEACMK